MRYSSSQIEDRFSKRVASLSYSEQDDLLRGLSVLEQLLVSR